MAKIIIQQTTQQLPLMETHRARTKNSNANATSKNASGTTSAKNKMNASDESNNY